MTQNDSPNQNEVAIDISTKTIGVLGGTGEQGRGLATRFAQAGLAVIIGSRTSEKANEVASEIGHGVKGLNNAETALASDVVIIAVPWDGHKELLESLKNQVAGKVVIDCVNPLGFDKQGAFSLVIEEGSAAQQAQSILADAKVVAAFHHISAKLLLDTDGPQLHGDVLVLGDDREATDVVCALASTLGEMRGIYAGRLRNAGQVEAFTANLISLNRRYKGHAGVQITGI